MSEATLFCAACYKPCRAVTDGLYGVSTNASNKAVSSCCKASVLIGDPREDEIIALREENRRLKAALDKAVRGAVVEIERLKAEIVRKDASLRSALLELESLWSLYGKSLTVYGWHLNGAGEPLDAFFDDISDDAMEKIKKALTKTEVEEDADSKNL